MAAQKKAAKKKAARQPAAKAPSPKPAKQEIVPEFLVVSVPDSLKEGSSVKVIYVARSLDDARSYVDKLSGNIARDFGILEKKAVLKREPIMRTADAARNIFAS